MIEVLHKLPMDEIAEIEELGRRCHKLDVIAPAYATVELEVQDIKSGEVVSRFADLSRSWTRNFYNILAVNTLGCAQGVLGLTAGAGKLSIKLPNESVLNQTTLMNVSGADVGGQGNENGVGSGWRGASATETHGIVIGTDATAESIDDYKMNALIAEGTGTGQMNYGAMGLQPVTWDAGTKKFKCVGVRVMTNNSTGSIDVKESGIYFKVCENRQWAYGTCFVRDKLAATVPCAAVSMLTVTYTLYSPAYPA